MLIKNKRLPIKQLVLYGLLPSFLKKIIYRIMGYKIGKNVTIGLGSIILGTNVEIKDNTSIFFINYNQKKYPESAKILKENPEYQARFK